MMWLTMPAFAADPAPGVLLPSAVPVDALHGEVSVTAAHVSLNALSSYGWLAGGAIRAGVAPVDRLWVELSAGVGYEESTSCGLFGGCSDREVARPSAALLTARYLAWESPGFSFGPTIAGGLDLAHGGGGFGGGLAVEGGSRRVRGDLSVGVAILAYRDGFFESPLPVGEGGVTVRIGTESRHALRFGVAEVLPDLSWRYEADRWFVELGVTGIPAALGGERVEVGARF